MIRHRRWIVIPILCTLLILAAQPIVAQGEDDEIPLSFSVQTLQIDGRFSEDAFTASFHLRTGEQEVTDIVLLPGDLVNSDGEDIVAGQYQVSPISISSILAHHGALVNVTLNNIPAPGTYEGSIEVLFAGRDPDVQLTLPIRVVATAKPNIELGAGSAQVAIKATRRLVPWGDALTEPVSFHIRQTVDAPVTIAQIEVMDPPDTNADAIPIPQSAIIITPDTPLDINAKTWQAFEIQIDMADLPAGHYGGTVIVSPQGGDDTTITVDVQLKDNWLAPLAFLAAGVALSFVVSFMTTTGAARLTALRDIDALRARLDAKTGLPSDFLSEQLEQLDALEQQARQQSPASVQAEIDALKTEITTAEGKTDGWRKNLRDWKVDFDRWQVGATTDDHIKALVRSPLLLQLRARIPIIEQKIDAGGFSRGEVEEMLDLLAEDMATVAALVDALPKILNNPDAQIQGILSTLEQTLEQATSLTTGDMHRLIVLLVEKKLMVESAPSPVEHFAVVAVPEEPPSPPSPPIRRRIIGWLTEPRNYLPLLSGVLGLLFLVLLLIAGMQALYIGRPTFGANRFADYVGLLLWGIGADASRKQLRDLESATGFLRQKLGTTDA
jgi:hypothetical protein